jgi:beta-glucanase (GH16 family)
MKKEQERPELDGQQAVRIGSYAALATALVLGTAVHCGGDTPSSSPDSSPDGAASLRGDEEQSSSADSVAPRPDGARDDGGADKDSGDADAPLDAVADTTSSSVDSGTAATPTGPSGAWVLRFDDEFNGTQVDTSKWSFQSGAEGDWSTTPFGTGNLGNQQLEFDEPGGCSVGGGTLIITAKPASITSAGGAHYAWSSCYITSIPSYSFQYGYIEERARLPSARGFWPAFWTWQTPGASYHETDAYEFYSDNHSNLYLTQHDGAGGACTIHPTFDPSAGYHVYGVDIEPTGTDFWIDGQNVCHVAGTSTGEANIIDDMFVYSQIPPVPGTVEHKYVDYVRAWQR